MPMHVDPGVLATVVRYFQSSVGSFPRSYLGLPLSCDKLRPNDFAPLISKVDRYLAGWRARLLSRTVRLVLINAVLDSIPTYAMAAKHPPPPAVFAALDKLWRAVLWSVVDRASKA
ncbi:hypothetical protein D1007_37695 [Hordeum vulgare]|nr:hypothetical protein D1007_37695 [Hordeum vulgare]